LSVARPLRSTLEQIADALPDIVMLGIGIWVIATFFRPILGFAQSITGLFGGGGTGATIATTGTTGSVHSRGPIGPPSVTNGAAVRLNPYAMHPPLVGPFTGNRFAWYYSYAGASTPINRFFRQLFREGQQ